MASWGELERTEPELTARARAHFDAHVHKTLATLRADGSPRISGVEVRFHDGELWLGSMPGSRKSADLLRDPRCALHSGSADPPGWAGDAKVAGRALAVDDPARAAAVYPAHPGPFDLFRLDVDELVVNGLDEAREAMLIDSWHPASGTVRITR